MEPIVSVALGLGIAALVYIATNRTTPKKTNKPPTNEKCGDGFAVSASGACWAITTAPDLSGLAPEVMKALIKNRLTESIGTKVSIVATLAKYPGAVAMLNGEIVTSFGTPADSYDVEVSSVTMHGTNVPASDRPKASQTVNVSPLSIATDSDSPGAIPDPSKKSPPTIPSLPSPLPTPDLGAFPGGSLGTTLPLDGVLDVNKSTMPAASIVPQKTVAILQYVTSLKLDTGKAIEVLVISRKPGDIDPRPFVGYLSADSAQKILGMDFAAGGLYVSFLPDKVFGVRPATGSDVPKPPTLSKAPLLPFVGGEDGSGFGEKVAPPSY